MYTYIGRSIIILYTVYMSEQVYVFPALVGVRVEFVVYYTCRVSYSVDNGKLCPLTNFSVIYADSV